MPIRLEVDSPDLDAVIPALAQEASQAGVRPSSPETSLYKKIDIKELIEKGADELGVVEALTRNELANLSVDGLENIKLPRSMRSVGETLSVFSDFVESYQKATHLRNISVYKSRGYPERYALVCSRALNTVVFEQAVKESTDERVYEETRYLARLTTELLMISDANVLRLENTKHLQVEAMNDLVNCGLDDPASLDAAFELSRNMLRDSPENLITLEYFIKGVKAEITSFLLVSDVETYSDYSLRKPQVELDRRGGVDGVLGVGMTRQGNIILDPKLYLDIKWRQNYYETGVCTLHPKSARGNESGPTRGDKPLTDLEAESLEIQLTTQTTVNKTGVPALVIRIPKELFEDYTVAEITELRTLHNEASQLYNEWLARIHTEVSDVVNGTASKERRQE